MALALTLSAGAWQSCAAAPKATAATAPQAPAGARRWDVPGGWFMLPDWEVRRHTVEKAMGTIAVARSGAAGGGMCLAWSYQGTPLSPKELADGGPAYLTLLKSFLKDADVPENLKVHGDNEVEVIAGHAAIVMRFAAGAAATETTLALWDCPQSKRTFATMCFAPQKSIAGRLFFAISKYAACHATPVIHDATGPLTVTAPPDWKTVEIAPNQQIIASPDSRSALYLFALSPTNATKISAESAASIVDTVGRLAGRLERREAAEITTDPQLQHDVARIKAVIQVDKRSALATFDVWICTHDPAKSRLFARAALSEAADGLDKAREILETVRCH